MGPKIAILESKRAILEAKMAAKLEEMSIKVECKNHVEYEAAFGAPRRRPGGHFGSMLEPFGETCGVARGEG